MPQSGGEGCVLMIERLPVQCRLQLSNCADVSLGNTLLLPEEIDSALRGSSHPLVYESECGWMEKRPM